MTRQALKEMQAIELIQLRKATIDSNRIYPDKSNVEFIKEIDEELKLRISPQQEKDMRIKLVMLDGICAGQVYDWDEIVPEFKINEPKDLNFRHNNCDLEDCDLDEITSDPIRYKLAFVSIDRKVALYTESGKSESIFNSRDWVVHPKRQYMKRNPIHFMENLSQKEGDK